MNQAAISVQRALPSTVGAIIAICTTDAGRLSRALNVMLGPTPVAHPALPGKAAPGQLSAVEIERIRQVNQPSQLLILTALFAFAHAFWVTVFTHVPDLPALKSSFYLSVGCHKTSFKLSAVFFI